MRRRAPPAGIEDTTCGRSLVAAASSITLTRSRRTNDHRGAENTRTPTPPHAGHPTCGDRRHHLWPLTGGRRVIDHLDQVTPHQRQPRRGEHPHPHASARRTPHLRRRRPHRHRHLEQTVRRTTVFVRCHVTLLGPSTRRAGVVHQPGFVARPERWSPLRSRWSIACVRRCLADAPGPPCTLLRRRELAQGQRSLVWVVMAAYSRPPVASGMRRPRRVRPRRHERGSADARAGHRGGSTQPLLERPLGRGAATASRAY